MPDKPTNEELQEHIEESEDARVAAEQRENVADEDEAAVRDAEAGRIPSQS